VISKLINELPGFLCPREWPIEINWKLRMIIEESYSLSVSLVKYEFFLY